jgi:hypothetical protein
MLSHFPRYAVQNLERELWIVDLVYFAFVIFEKFAEMCVGVKI